MHFTKAKKNNLIVKILSSKKYYNRLIFDGYPRNLEQAKSLDSQIKKYKQKISCVLALNVDKESIIKRILGRRTCTNCGLILMNIFALLQIKTILVIQNS